MVAKAKKKAKPAKKIILTQEELDDLLNKNKPRSMLKPIPAPEFDGDDYDDYHYYDDCYYDLYHYNDDDGDCYHACYDY